MIERYHNPLASDWPSCPRCGEYSLVTGGLYAACCKCSFFGDASVVSKFLVGKVARVRLALSSLGNRPVVFLGRKSPEGGARIQAFERATEIARMTSHEQVWLKIKDSMKAGEKFTPLCVMSYAFMGLHFATLPMRSPHELMKARMHASKQDIVTTAWIDGGGGVLGPDDAIEKIIDGPGRLVMQTHFYGAPSIQVSYEFQIEDGSLVFKDRVVGKNAIFSWIKQPVCWGIVHPVPGSVQIRSLSIREVGSGTINACVMESMDGPPVYQVSISEEGWKDPVVTNFEIETSEAGIEMAKNFIKEVVDVADPESTIKYDREWGIDEDAFVPLNDIRKNPEIWEAFSEAR